MTNEVNLMYGTLSGYQALGSYDENTLYFVDGVIYKGEKPQSMTAKKVSQLPDKPAQGVLYVLDDYSASFYNGSGWQNISVGVVGTIGSSTDNDNKVVTQAAIKAYVEAKMAGMDDTSTIEELISAAKSEAISTAEGYTDTEIESVKKELKAEISSKVASVFRFKEFKDSFDDIESVDSPEVGDVYGSKDDGKEYVYTESGWELLGFEIDLSSYATKEAMTKAINDKAQEIIEEIDAYNKSDVDKKITEVKGLLTTHEENSTVHITSEERSSWSAKADVSDVNSAKEDAIAAAKLYTDGKDTAMSSRVSAVEDAITWKTIE